jgi:beta-lactamase regulating signal transducer with metallopeptidase domain
VWSSPTGTFSWILAWSSVHSIDENPTLRATATWQIETKELSDFSFEGYPDTERNTGPEFTPPGVISWSQFGFLVAIATCPVPIAFTLYRYLRFRKSITESTEEPPKELTKLFNSLIKSLNVKRFVRLQLVDEDVTPCVAGIINPTVILPKWTLDKMTTIELEMVLAHELIHLRRGDLLVTMLQWIASSLWWFHPLIRTACSRLSQESERCCDEETINSLQCERIVYARCLIKVLEWEHRSHFSPALPGVRPMQITHDRLERVMKLRNGFKKTPHWTWVYMILLIAIVAPGASINGQEERPVSEKPKTATVDNQNEQENVERRIAPVDSSDLTTFYYNLKGAIEQIESEQGLDHKSAVKSLYDKISKHHTQHNVIYTGDERVIAITTSRANHEAIRKLLREHNVNRFGAVLARSLFFEGSHEIDVEGATWSSADGNDWAILSADQLTAISTNRTEQYRIVSAPVIVISNGQRGVCEIVDTVMLERNEFDDPNRNDADERVMHIKTGFKLSLSPKIDYKNSTVSIACELERNILFRIPSTNKYQNKHTLLNAKLTATKDLNRDQFLAIRTRQTNRTHPTQGLCVMAVIGVRYTDPSESEPNRSVMDFIERERKQQKTQNLPRVITTKRFDDSEDVSGINVRMPIILAR